MILSPEKLVTFELCPRRYVWTDTYPTRIPLVRALYMALDAGLRAENGPERAAENALMQVSARPGLDIYGNDVYAVAFHHARLAGILAVALRSAWPAPWKPIDPLSMAEGHVWHSACYDAGDGHPRRIVLADRWGDERRLQELAGWRTMGEVCALDRTILVTAIEIGTMRDKHRISAWTRCWRHPKNHTFRFQRRTSSEDFGATWNPIWREDATISTPEWMAQMRADGCIHDLVHTMQVPVPRGSGVYREEMLRIAGEMSGLPAAPPMRLAGCHGFSKCPFLGICPDTNPENHGFSRIILQGSPEKKEDCPKRYGNDRSPEQANP